jgi:hypothetical protein
MFSKLSLKDKTKLKNLQLKESLLSQIKIEEQFRGGFVKIYPVEMSVI